MVSNILKNNKNILITILNSLKDIYTFKELEEILGVSQNTLWKYTSLTSIPEEPTAIKIIEKIINSNIIYNFLNKNIEYINNGEEWKAYWSMGFCTLASLVFLQNLRANPKNLNNIIIYPEKLYCFGAALSSMLRKKFCIIFNYKEYIRSKKLILNSYYINNNIIPYFIVKDCIKNDSKIIFVTEVLNENIALLNYIKNKFNIKEIFLFTILKSNNNYIKNNLEYNYFNLEEYLEKRFPSNNPISFHE